MLIAGSAGGELIEARVPVDYEEVNDYVEVDLTVRGLMGGHSGGEIHKPRGNSNKILNGILKEILETIDIRLVSITGGNKDNAIPRQTTAKIAVKTEDIFRFKSLIEEIKNKTIKAIYISQRNQI